MPENSNAEESPKQRSDHFYLGVALAVFVALVVLVLAFDDNDDASASSTDNSTVSLPAPPASPSPTPTPTPTFASEPSEEPEETPAEVKEPDIDTSSLATNLAAVANRYGYGPADESYADIIVLVVCDPIESGLMTWEDSVAEDIASGAPASDAEAFNDYARTVFCPGMGYDVG